jgi:hypothetical protein
MIPKRLFDDARARVERAKAHLRELEAEVARGLATNENWAVLVLPHVTGEFSDATHAPWNVPPIMLILISETVHNLRSAMEYLVYDLAGRPIPGRHLAFPVTRTEEDWVKQQGKLGGLTQAQKDVIKKYQPFRLSPADPNRAWTYVLDDLWNEEKHRQLIVGEPEARVLVKRNTLAKPHVFHSKSLAVPPGLEATLSFIRFADGTRVTDGLAALICSVESVIDEFDPRNHGRDGRGVRATLSAFLAGMVNRVWRLIQRFGLVVRRCIRNRSIG